MKKFVTVFIASILVFLCVVSTVAALKRFDEYPQSMIVVQVDKATNTVTCKDANGNLWQFKGCEDWMVDDVAAMIMNNKGTAEISDDEIIAIRYCGSCSDG